MKWYTDAMDAYERICRRLGTEEEDADLEMIVNAFLKIQKYLCLKMYDYGVNSSKCSK